MNFCRFAAAVLLAGIALPADAADPAACAAPADLTGTPLAAWTQADGGSDTRLLLGTPTTLVTTAGAAKRTLHIAETGRYGFAADGRVWIDVTADGPPLVSVDHGHGPACSGIRKIVWFDLTRGDYAVELTKAAPASVRLLVVRAP